MRMCEAMAMKRPNRSRAGLTLRIILELPSGEPHTPEAPFANPLKALPHPFALTLKVTTSHSNARTYITIGLNEDSGGKQAALKA